MEGSLGGLWGVLEVDLKLNIIVEGGRLGAVLGSFVGFGEAVSETFSLISTDGGYASSGFFDDSTFYIALLIAVFVAFYGTLSTDTSQHKKGIIATVALESILKLF